MKILIFHNILWSHYKAAVFSSLHQQMEASGDELLVVHVAENERIRAHMKMPDLSMHQYPYQVLDRQYIEEWKTRPLVTAMLNKVNEFKPDLVVLPGYAKVAYQIVCLRLAIRQSVTLFNTVDSTPYDQKRGWFKERYKSFLLARCDGVFCYGQLHARYIQSLGLKPEKIHIRLQATDASKYQVAPNRNSNDKKRLLFVGRLSAEKNLAVAIEQFLNVNSDWEMWIVGDGDQGDELKKRFESESAIRFLGNQPWDGLAQIYQQVSCLILPSLSETWGLVVNEAMHCGLAVLVSQHCGCSLDLVQDGSNGFRFNPLDPFDLREKLDSIMSLDHDDLVKMGSRSLEIINRFSPENAANQMLVAFHQSK